MKHTQGEWIKGIRHTRKGAAIVTIQIPKQPLIDIYQIDSDDCSNPICCSTEQHANAKLIAAAPDLLEALIQIKREIEYSHSINKLKQEGKDWTNELTHINSAIKKATE